MSDYISREAAIKKFEDAEYLYDPEPGAKRYTVEDAKEILNDVPAADARPVKRGEWIPETDRHYHWHCSECGYVIGAMRMDADFCLKCGADMTGGADV